VVSVTRPYPEIPEVEEKIESSFKKYIPASSCRDGATLRELMIGRVIFLFHVL